MKFKETFRGDVCILGVQGKLKGCQEAEELYDEFKACSEKHVTKFILDLQKLDWSGSLGIGALIGCLTAARGAGGDLRLSGLNHKILQLLQITKLDSVFKIYNTVDQAYDSFSRTAG
jgi:anti-sigma B factor antagonist